MINCVITSPKETRVYKNLLSVSLPAFFGQIQILSSHAESFITLKEGDIIAQKSQKKQDDIHISGGECHIKDDVVNIIL